MNTIICPSNIEISEGLQQMGFKSEVVSKGVEVSLNRYLWQYEVEQAIDAHFWYIWVKDYHRIDRNKFLIEIEK